MASNNYKCPYTKCGNWSSCWSDYCSNHACQQLDCTKPREIFGRACEEHICRFLTNYYTGCINVIDSEDGIHCAHHKRGGVWHQEGKCQCKACVHPTKSAYKV
jgi:hypothetical protein